MPGSNTIGGSHHSPRNVTLFLTHCPVEGSSKSIIFKRIIQNSNWSTVCEPARR